MMATDKDKVKACALNLLSRREHSRKELKQKLLQRKFPLACIETVLDEVENAGWQSNQRFAEIFVQNRIRRGYGQLKIQYELRNRGLDEEWVLQLLAQDEDIWQESLMALWQKKYAGKAVSVEKQMRFFQSRGFTNQQIRKFGLKEK